jgi:hypothetical protein
MTINNQYYDIYDNLTELTDQEIQYFHSIINHIKSKFNFNNCNITNYNHELYNGKHKEALGICRTEDYNTFEITIDNYFIHECFISIKRPYMNILGETLEGCICHELAHIQYQRHGKKHTALTEQLLSMVA